MNVLSRGALSIPSPGLSDVVARGFVLLDTSTDVIRRSKVPSRKARRFVLEKFLSDEPLGCEAHESKISSVIHCCLPNMFFHNQRERTTVAVVKGKVTIFKKSLCKK